MEAHEGDVSFLSGVRTGLIGVVVVGRVGHQLPHTSVHVMRKRLYPPVQRVAERVIWRDIFPPPAGNGPRALFQARSEAGNEAIAI